MILPIKGRRDSEIIISAYNILSEERNKRFLNYLIRNFRGDKAKIFQKGSGARRRFDPILRVEVTSSESKTDKSIGGYYSEESDVVISWYTKVALDNYIENHKGGR